MLRHYLRTTLRVLSRNATFSAINLVGLSVGIASALLLLLFVYQEVSFDRFHDKADRIYRAWVLEDYGPNQVFFNTITPVRTGPDLQAGLPEVEAFARFDWLSDTVRRDDVGHIEDLYMVDPTFLEIFDFEVLRGDAEVLFTSQENIILTESAASRHFGTEDPMGQVLSVDFNGAPRQFEVAGLMADPPKNSSLQFDFLLPYAITEWLYPERMFEAFFNVAPETYVLLREGAVLADVEAKTPDLLNGLLGDRVEPGQYQVGLQPLLDIHMNPDFPLGYAPVVNPAYVRILFAVALLILAIACINFVTLSVTRSLGRAKEIGVRKVIGAGRRQLMIQYWGEAFLLTGLSVGLGLVLARLALPAFNTLAQRDLVLQPEFVTVLLIGGLFAGVGLVAGVYPALLLSGFSPVEAFRGRVAGKADRSNLRKGLVVAQFALSILLVASTLVIGSQLRFLQNKDLGFSKDSVVVIPTEVRLAEGNQLADRLRFRTEGMEAVESITSAAMLFDSDGWGRVGFTARDGTYRRHFVNVVDHDFVQTLGLRLVHGRDFSRDQPSDSSRAIMVNEAFVEAYGWDDALVGQIPGDFDEHEVIGVVQDFHFASLHTAIEPAMFTLDPNVAFSGAQDFDYDGSFSPEIAIRISGGDTPGTISTLRGIWGDIAPELPFTYSFLDEAITQQYSQEERLSDIVTLGALLSILIAGLGLFGLAAMSVVRRSKEIGLRKVLGANVAGILRLFNAEFSLLVLIAFALAAPAAWFGMQYWLDGFAYRTALGPLPFLGAGLAAAAVMAVAVSSQALKAAWSNPVDALRDE